VGPLLIRPPAIHRYSRTVLDGKGFGHRVRNSEFNRYNHDLTGFIDGTENPSLLEALGVLVVPYGTVTNHGTVFVGFSADQQRLAKILDSMAGVTDGIRDALTNYATPLTGAYYFVPSVDAIRGFVTEPAD
jgi:deferrochelatase/peroxidase EfeB